MNQNFRLDFPEIAVWNESWAVGRPNFMSNPYSHLIVALIFGYHGSSSRDI